MISKQCAILVGGTGTRLGALTREVPKPLLHVAGQPFLNVLVSETVRRGFEDIVLLAGYMAAQVEDYSRELQSRLGHRCRVRVSIETEPLGTGGAVQQAGDLLEEKFLLLNGDTWFDFNWLDLFDVAVDGCALAARQVPDADRHETLALARNGFVTEVVPRSQGTGPALVNGGVYVFQKSEFADFPDRFSIEDDLLPRLVSRSRLRGRIYDGFFLDIGVPQTFTAAQTLIPARRRRPAVFFDRDGVLNYDENYVGSIGRFRWMEGAREAVRLANNLGYYVFVVTNQAGVARGFYDEAAVELLHCWMAQNLREHGASIDDWRYCPYHPDAEVERYRSHHSWRKPQPGMILDLLDVWEVDASGSILVGDKETDCEAARLAGIKPFLFRGGNLLDFLSGILVQQSAGSSGNQV